MKKIVGFSLVLGSTTLPAGGEHAQAGIHVCYGRKKKKKVWLNPEGDYVCIFLRGGRGGGGGGGERRSKRGEYAEGLERRRGPASAGEGRRGRK